MDQTELDKLVGTEPEDVVQKVHPTKGAPESPADKASSSGGESKLPTNITPFKLGG